MIFYVTFLVCGWLFGSNFLVDLCTSIFKVQEFKFPYAYFLMYKLNGLLCALKCRKLYNKLFSVNSSY
jgi:hypothetical protein